jgi:hypothetical protein
MNTRAMATSATSGLRPRPPSKVFGRDVVLRFVDGDTQTYTAAQNGWGALDALPAAVILAALAENSTMPVNLFLAVVDRDGKPRAASDAGKALAATMVMHLREEAFGSRVLWAQAISRALRVAAPRVQATKELLAPIFELVPAYAGRDADLQRAADAKRTLPDIWAGIASAMQGAPSVGGARSSGRRRPHTRHDTRKTRRAVLRARAHGGALA